MDDPRLDLVAEPLEWPPACNQCGCALEEPGAVVLGPPGTDSKCKKHHLCVACWDGTWAPVLEGPR